MADYLLTPQGRALATVPGTPAQPESVPPPAPPDNSNKKPDTSRFSEIPTTGFYEYDRAWSIRQILVELEQGILRNAALLTDGILRDDRIAAVLETRINGLLGSPIICKPPRAGRKARKLCERIQGTPETPGEFSGWFPAAELSDLLRWGIMLGVGLGELEWDTSGDEWVPRLKVWHPQFVFWIWDANKPNSGSYWLTTANRGTIEITPGDGRWVLFTPYGYRRAWLRGAMRSMAMLFLSRQWVFRDWNRYDEVHGLPIRKAKVPANASETDKQSFADSVANIGSETAIQIPVSATDTASFDLDLLEAKADTYHAFADFMAKLDDSIAIRLLGNNLTTQTTGGSLAAARVGDNVRADIRKADAVQLAQCLREQAIRPWCRFNVGADDVAPHLEFETDPPKDLALESQTLVNAATALSALADKGVPVDLVAFAEKFGIPLVEMDEDEIAALLAPTPDAPPDAPTDGGPPGIDEPAKPEGEQAPKPDDEPDPKAATVRATNKRTRTVTLKSAKRWNVADPASQLAKAGTLAGRKALAPDLKLVIDAINGAKDWQDVRARVLDAFRGMDPAKAAEAVERASVLAELSGRRDVLKGE